MRGLCVGRGRRKSDAYVWDAADANYIVLKKTLNP